MRHLQTFRMIQQVARVGSIRRAAEDMNITASALNRRVQAFEAEFGAQIFERLPRGVRLNPAGELLMQHILGQSSDLARVQSQIADLAGERRGHVSIACSQGLTPIFLPDQVARYRAQHPRVTFSVRVRDRSAAEHDLAAFSSDLALVFEPVYLAEFEVIKAISQPVCAVMSSDHPLAGRANLRLRDCLEGPHVVPSEEYGVRHLLDTAVRGKTLTLSPVVESDSFEMMRYYVLYERAVSFQIPIGLLPQRDPRLMVREMDPRDIAPGLLLLGQKRGRTLPVASAKFAMQLAAALEDAEQVFRAASPDPGRPVAARSGPP